MAKDSIIVVYIPDQANLLKQFWGLYYSCVHKTNLWERFDFLVTGPPSLQSRLPREHCHFVPLEELSKEKDFCYVYSGNDYGYVNSFAPFLDDKCQEIILKYKHCLRLDVDTFVCPGLKDLQCGADEIIVGNAAYSSETARLRLPEILSNLDLSDQNVHNIGSTWFSNSKAMIKHGAETVKYVKYFLKNHFSEHEGSWPQWYAGVILLYAGHVALNSSPLKITQSNKLDFYSTSKEDVTPYYTLHCWHTDDFYSKHWFMNGRYKDRKTDSQSIKCNEYAFDCVINGSQNLDKLVPIAETTTIQVG